MSDSPHFCYGDHCPPLDLGEFKPGERVELVHTNDSVTRLVPGDRGTVTRVFDNDGRVVSILWDNGSTLAMLLDEGDLIKHVRPETNKEEWDRILDA